jgi:DNA-binding response OmpR family regulator
LVEDGALEPVSPRDLTEDGFDVVHERSGESGFFRSATEKFDVLVLAPPLPGRSELEILTALRRNGVTTPALVLSVRLDVDVRVAMLDAGADDCRVLPIAVPELRARLRALARRGATDPVQLYSGEMVLDPIARTARRAGRPLQLTMREFRLLEYLMRHQGTVVTRERLSNDVWGKLRKPMDNALDVHIARLRKKVDGDEAVRLIHTIRGVGFSFGERVMSARGTEDEPPAVDV